jgi:hypothetical protein
MKSRGKQDGSWQGLQIPAGRGGCHGIDRSAKSAGRLSLLIGPGYRWSCLSALLDIVNTIQWRVVKRSLTSSINCSGRRQGDFTEQ